MKNKLKLFVLATILSMGLTACGGGNKKPTESTDTGTPSETDTGGESTTDTEETEPGSETDTGSETTEEVPPEEDNPNIAYFENLIEGAEADVQANKGKLVLWYGYGLGGNVTNVSFTEQNEISIDYTNTGNWYGVQLFYALPYGEENDEINISFDVTATVTGGITLNGKAFDLTANQKLSISENKTIGGANLTAISLQLGVDGKGPLPSGNIKMSQPVIKDLKNAYHKVNFMVGEKSAKSIYVKDSRTVAAPEDPKAPSGQVFRGWFEKNTNNEFNPNALVTKAVDYEARFINESEASKYTVTIMNGTDVLAELEVTEGRSVPTDKIVPPFAYKLRNLYKDAGKSDLYNGEGITGNTTLYADLVVSPDATWMNDSGGIAIPAMHFENDAEGALHFKGMNPWGSADAWVVQVNFSVPAGEAGTYHINFDYKVNADGADVHIWDSGTSTSYGFIELPTASSYTSKTVEFPGSTLTSKAILTFEFGKIAGTTPIDFYLTNVRLVKVA